MGSEEDCVFLRGEAQRSCVPRFLCSDDVSWWPGFLTRSPRAGHQPTAELLREMHPR